MAASARGWRCALGLAGVLMSCAGAGAGTPATVGPGPARGARRDVHGEPLTLLPPDAALVVRLDAVGARASAQWSGVRALLDQQAGNVIRDARDVLGFDPLEQGDALALGLYLPPGLETVPDAHGWLVLYVRGTFDRSAVLAAAGASSTRGEPLAEREVDGLRFYASGSRGYYFAAADVLIFFDPALAGRVARQLTGTERRSEENDPRFAPLVSQLPDPSGTLRLYADVRGLRATGALSRSPTDPSSIDLAAMSVSAPNEVHAAAAARASSDVAAAQVAAALDQLRRSYLARWDIRLLGLGRLLNQGVTSVSDGPYVRVRAEAYPDEVSRILTAARMVQ